MKNHFHLLPATSLITCIIVQILISSNVATAQVPPSIQWQKSLGGTGGEEAWSVEQIGNVFFVVGQSGSDDGDVYGNHGGGDYWVVQLDAQGDTVWTKCYGGSGFEQENSGTSIHSSLDGGFILIGLTTSNDGDVSGNHGSYDYWIMKSTASGSIDWQKCLGGSADDYGRSIQQTLDGGFIAAGYSSSSDGDVWGDHGGGDYWVVKLNSNGDTVWTKCYGGSGFDEPYSIRQTTDGGFIVTGRSYSNDGDVWGNHGGSDYWVVKLNASGDTAWTKCFGGSDEDQASSIEQTADGGFIVSGVSLSTDGDVSGNHGEADYWIVKLLSDGTLDWAKCLGGSDYDNATNVHQTLDGGFIVSGTTESDDYQVSGFHGYYDYWIVKLDPSGNIEWQKCLGGTSGDLAYSVKQTFDGGYIVAGKSLSTDGDVTGNHGGLDYWVVRLSTSTGIETLNGNSKIRFAVSPNPACDFFNVQLQMPGNETFDAMVTISNILGQTVFEKTSTCLNGKLEEVIFLDEKLAWGVYKVRVRSAKQQWSEQVIVMK